ncbi:protein translocase subunit SecF [Arthrospira sp. O9.13F]|nr:protein translocase subunit SecF [Arthrospira sp. O9.13F]
MTFSVTKRRSLWWIISAAVILAGIVGMLISWTNPDIGAPIRPGLDFVGGTRLQLELDCTVPGNCDGPIEIDQVREVLQAQDLGSSSIQLLDNDPIQRDRQIVSVRTKNLNVDERTQLEAALREAIGVFDPLATQIDTVGPTLGRQIFISGLQALLVAFAGITVYLTFRFQFDYAVFAFVALFHDVFLTMGVFSIFGLVFGLEADTLFLVALLTIIGFSVNDTVVIYDRIREILKQMPDASTGEVVDNAVNQTLARSINTTVTTILPLFCIFLFGGETLKYFALTLIIGFIAGSYSSIFIASTLLGWWRDRKASKSTIVPNDEPQPVSREK